MNADIANSVLRFVAEQLAVKPEALRPETRLVHDLRVDGWDGPELVKLFAEAFSVDLSSFEPEKHFGPESGPNLFVWLWWTVTRSWPSLVPITIADLQQSASIRRWVVPEHAAV